jgi:hypothetical protein
MMIPNYIDEPEGEPFSLYQLKVSTDASIVPYRAFTVIS